MPNLRPISCHFLPDITQYAASIFNLSLSNTNIDNAFCKSQPQPFLISIFRFLESFIIKKRDKSAALAFLKKALRRHGKPEAIVTDGLRSYPAAMREIGNLDRQETGRWLNNRAENSHLPLRRRERAMQRFRRMKSLQKFASIHASLHNHFNSERHLVDRQAFKERRSAAWAEWQSLAS